MKSQLSDPNIKTNCKNCAFAIYKEKTQVSCAFNRIETFGSNVVEAYDQEKEFFVINRLCNYYRDKLWGYSLNDMDKVEYESSLSFDIVIDCNSVTAINENNIVYFINSIDYDDKKIKITLLHDYNSYDTVKDCVADMVKRLNKVITISVCSDINAFMHNMVMKSKRGYHCLINGNIDLMPNPDMFYLLDQEINKKLKRILSASSNDTDLINNFMFKVLNHNLNMTYNDTIKKIIEESNKNNMHLEC